MNPGFICGVLVGGGRTLSLARPEWVDMLDMLDETNDPARRSWVEGADGSGFPIQNLPFGVFRRPGHRPRLGVAIGDFVLALAVVSEAGLLPGIAPDVFRRPHLNELLALGSSAWRGLRRRLVDLLTEGETTIRERAPAALVRRGAVEMLCPVAVGDFVDFYSSIHHATNMGRLFRPDAEPLLPNWRRLPVGYHGRAGTVVASGTKVTRPQGLFLRAGGVEPTFAPTEKLDFELEVGFITGPGPSLGQPIPIDEASDHIFGLVLVNDWSARDIQAFEYQPLGPFLGKSFATSISPWVVTLNALAPFRVPAPPQDPTPPPHLRTDAPWAIDLSLEVDVATAAGDATTVCRTNLAEQYWTIAQQLAHATSNGATVGAGDLFGSGTVSGPVSGSLGSLVEITADGTQPVGLTGGEQRAYLADGDTVVMRGASAGSAVRIDFGEVTGTVYPALRN